MRVRLQVALDEIGSTRILDATKDGTEAEKIIGTSRGNDVHVAVDV